MNERISRREFLKLAGVGAGGALLTACGVTPSEPLPTQQPIPTEIPSPTTTTEPSSTPEATPTPTEIPVRDEWQVSADGLILYNEAELYDGMFTINPERTGYLYEQLMRSLYQINVAGGNRPFLRQFPTLEAFREYAQTGQPINNMWVAIDHPGSGVRYMCQATWAPIEQVDLSSIAIAINHLTYDDIVHPTIRDERPFFTIDGMGELVIERVEINGRFVIRFTFRQSLYDEPAYGPLGLSDDYPPEHNLAAITQLMNDWSWEVDHMRDEGGDDIRISDVTPPIFNISKSWPSEGEFREMAEDIENSPFRLR